jgi:hypothetical protein
MRRILLQITGSIARVWLWLPWSTKKKQGGVCAKFSAQKMRKFGADALRSGLAQVFLETRATFGLRLSYGANCCGCALLAQCGAQLLRKYSNIAKNQSSVFIFSFIG